MIADDFLQQLYQQVPLTQAMQVQWQSYDQHSLKLKVPLAPNRNDKNTAFAGSITALASITGWALLTLWQQEQKLFLPVAIYDAHFIFQKPITEDFSAAVSLPTESELSLITETIHKNKNARVNLDVDIVVGEQAFSTLKAKYAILAKRD